ncbi:BZ3500_MvSof-1268-A1-R1_Chr6-3g08714 [Microbotryum saponariae]|uniref:BZ3500_MvSof-1268-A1-R1_Chr6-3g08714 protein n=1 Tax=Microbotryum saponariae TaxID=289078 RepID=A0A2X0MDK3_9BASI|nr:BZ3500_MvSof-1268-A1-R1_Chr6-3g08714 [Microbotryum saponariae]SDA07315.1 BZ3501_MvSof-1269-A2-R1_Chr6-2g08417 [Microbotryum saponariae]
MALQAPAPTVPRTLADTLQPLPYPTYASRSQTMSTTGWTRRKRGEAGDAPARPVEPVCSLPEFSMLGRVRTGLLQGLQLRSIPINTPIPPTVATWLDSRIINPSLGRPIEITSEAIGLEFFGDLMDNAVVPIVSMLSGETIGMKRVDPNLTQGQKGDRKYEFVRVGRDPQPNQLLKVVCAEGKTAKNVRRTYGTKRRVGGKMWPSLDEPIDISLFKAAGLPDTLEGGSAMAVKMLLQVEGTKVGRWAILWSPPYFMLGERFVERTDAFLLCSPLCALHNDPSQENMWLAKESIIALLVAIVLSEAFPEDYKIPDPDRGTVAHILRIAQQVKLRKCGQPMD